MSPRPTMRDVARAAGVSLKTVSRVVNDEPGVGSGTSARVHAAIARLGFLRNDLARSLRMGGSSATIGVVIEDLGNPYFSAIARAVERTARQHGHMVIVISSEEAPERDSVAALVQRRVDGLVVVPSSQDHRYLRAEMDVGGPIVFVDRPPVGIEADAILLDNAGGARRAVEHLLALGHRRVGFVGGLPEVFTSRERLRGYLEALAGGGLAPGDGLVRLSARDVDGAMAATDELLALSEPPTAILAKDNRCWVGVLRALRARGTDVAVVGFDDFELADMLQVPVTVVSHDPERMGQMATELLFARLAGDERPPQRIVLPVELVTRGPGRR